MFRRISQKNENECASLAPDIEMKFPMLPSIQRVSTYMPLHSVAILRFVSGGCEAPKVAFNGTRFAPDINYRKAQVGDCEIGFTVSMTITRNYHVIDPNYIAREG